MRCTRADRISKMQSSLSTPAKESNKNGADSMTEQRSIVRRDGKEKCCKVQAPSYIPPGRAMRSRDREKKAGPSHKLRDKPCTEYEVRQTLTVATAQLVNGQQEKKNRDTMCMGNEKEDYEKSIHYLFKPCEQGSRAVYRSLSTRRLVSFVWPSFSHHSTEYMYSTVHYLHGIWYGAVSVYAKRLR